MAIQTRHRSRAPRGLRDVNLISLGVLLIALVAIAVVLIGVARGETSPFWVTLPTLLGFWCIATLRR